MPHDVRTFDHEGKLLGVRRADRQPERLGNGPQRNRQDVDQRGAEERADQGPEARR